MYPQEFGSEDDSSDWDESLSDISEDLEMRFVYLSFCTKQVPCLLFPSDMG